VEELEEAALLGCAALTGVGAVLKTAQVGPDRVRMQGQPPGQLAHRHRPPGQ